MTLSQEFINAGSPDASNFQSLSNLLIKSRYSGFQVAMIILSIARLMLCHLLFKSRLIPRPISIVGIIRYALVLLSAVLDLMGIIDTTGTAGILYVPGALFELFLLPIWLIAKGFNPSAKRT